MTFFAKFQHRATSGRPSVLQQLPSLIYLALSKLSSSFLEKKVCETSPPHDLLSVPKYISLFFFLRRHRALLPRLPLLRHRRRRRLKVRSQRLPASKRSSNTRRRLQLLRILLLLIRFFRLRPPQIRPSPRKSRQA